MGKNQSASGLTNIIQYDNNGNVSFVSGSTTLMQISSSGAITTTGVISGSNALSSSYSLNSGLLNGTGSVGFATTASLLEVSSSQQQISASQQQLSSSFLTLTASFNAVSASQQQISASYIALSASYNTFSGSASTRITENSSSIQQISSSQQQISASLLNVIAIGATTGSNSFRATQSITGSLTVTGQIIAQTLNVQQVTSSIIYSSGSNNFGCDLNSRQTFTGSVLITGSLTIAGASSATSYSGTTIFGSTIACSPIGCFATSCATSFIGGTLSGTTIYGSTAVCSAVGKFTSCIDAGTGTFSGNLLNTNSNFQTYGSASFGVSTWGLSIGNGNVSANYYRANDHYFQNGAGTQTLQIASTGAATFCATSAVGLTVNGANASDGTISKFARGGSEKNFYISSTNNQYINLGTEGDFRFKTGVTVDQPYATGCDAMVIKSTGNVLIGTTTDRSFKLVVEGTDNNNLMGSYNTTSCASLRIQSNQTINYIVSATNPLQFEIGGAIRMHITSTGISCFACQVCSPTFKGGSFNGTTGYFSCHIELNDTGIGWIYGYDKNHSIIMRGDRNGCPSDYTNYYQYGGNLSTCKGHNFWTDGVLASQTIKMQIANNGICMTVPLYVCNIITAANGSIFGTAAGSGQAMTIQAGSNCRAIIFKNAGAGDGSLWLYGTSTSIDYSFSTYSVGSAFYLCNNGNYDFYGSDISDRRQKDNICYITDSQIYNIMKLKSVSFNKKTLMGGLNNNVHTGFIAQDVLEAGIPNLVHGKEEEGYGLDYNGILSLAVKAIQEQQCKIALLESCLGIA